MRRHVFSILAAVAIVATGLGVVAVAPHSAPAKLVERAVPLHAALAATYEAYSPWRHYHTGWDGAYYQVVGGGDFHPDGGDDTVDMVVCVQYAVGGNTGNPGWSGCSPDTYQYHSADFSLTVTVNYGYSTYFRSYVSACDDTYGDCVSGYSVWTWLVK